MTDSSPAPNDDRDDAIIVDLGIESRGPDGAVWSLPHGGDLDANLVHLGANSEIDAHVNDEVDVMIVVQSGSAELHVDGQQHELPAGHLAVVAKGALRSIRAGETGVAYISVHRRRGPLGISARRPD